MLFRHRHSDRFDDLVVVWVMVSDMFRTVPVLSPAPPGALLVVTSVVLMVCRLKVLRFMMVPVYLPPMRLMVREMFPFKQWFPLLLCSL